MKFYLFLCISLTLTSQSFSRNIELLNTENTLNSSESTTIQSIESTLNSTENVVTPNTESNSNSTENVVTSNTESTLNSSENTSTTIKIEPECPENMMTFPWRTMAATAKCYCEYPYLPLPLNDTCFELFMQGPCEPGNFLVQSSWVDGELPLPGCAPNSCLEDGLIPYNGTCHNITQPICEYGNLYFRETTAEVTCRLLVRPRTSINVPLRHRCSAGSRPDRTGRCRKML